MPFFKTMPDAASNATNLFYEDLGTGKPVVFIHGWPLNHEMWEYQLSELPLHNMRCIAYDRRGFGKSDRRFKNYDYDTLAADLNALLDHLKLTKVILVGFSMGGGEIARYIGKYGTGRIEKVVLISSVTPYRLKTPDNPEGAEKAAFDETIQRIGKDRPAFLAEFSKKFYGVTTLSNPVSQPMLDWHQKHCLMSSARAMMDCVRSFSETDFRNDIPKITVPTLIIHGDEDKTVPISAGNRTAALLPHATYIVYEGAPHGLFITEKERLNADLIQFINGKTSTLKA
jgi:pimeloyl-ACP methyl ester carboxylesterase